MVVGGGGSHPQISSKSHITIYSSISIKIIYLQPIDCTASYKSNIDYQKKSSKNFHISYYNKSDVFGMFRAYYIIITVSWTATYSLEHKNNPQI